MRVILFTCSESQAPDIVRTLVEERLVGCGNILPAVRAIYRWQGRIEDDRETLVLAETTDEVVDVAMARIRELHSYDVPKILAIVPDRCDAPYDAWLRSEVSLEQKQSR